MGFESVIRRLLALPELTLRCHWLRSHLEALVPWDAARLLNALCEQNERGSQPGREAMMAVALSIIALGDCPLVSSLRSEAKSAGLLSLDRLLRRSPPPVRNDVPVEALPVPDYGTGRELTLGERRSLARRPDRRRFDRLLLDPHPLVIRQLLTNPMLTEDDVVKLAVHRPARVEAMRELSFSVRWLSSGRVRAALLLNPGSPESITIPLLALCTRPQLRALLCAPDIPLSIRATAREHLERMPPLDVMDPNVTLQ